MQFLFFFLKSDPLTQGKSLFIPLIIIINNVRESSRWRELKVVFSQSDAPESVSHRDGDCDYEAKNDIDVGVACDE